MGASQTRYQQTYHDLMMKSGFSLEQIKNLHYRFQQLSGNNETISKENLNIIPALEGNPIKSQIIDAFFDKRNQRQNETGSFGEISFEQFVMVMSHFRPPPSAMTDADKEAVRTLKLRFLFNMHDTDNDGIITLEEYRKLVTPKEVQHSYVTHTLQKIINHEKGKAKPVVEELLSTEQMEEDATRDIADAAMLEVASTNVPHMRPDEFYEGITFQHFEQILKDLEMESRMHIRFLDVDTTTMHCGKLSS